MKLEDPSAAALLAHEPMMGFDIEPKQRIREAEQFVAVTVPTYDRNMGLVEGIIVRDAWISGATRKVQHSAASRL